LQHKHNLTAQEWARFYYSDKILNLFSQSSPRSVEVFVREFKEAHGADALRGGVLILDTYARAIAGGNESSAQDTTITQDALSKLQEELGCTIVVLAHCPHNELRIRGSTNIQAFLDEVLTVRKESDSRYFGPGPAKDLAGFPDVPYAIGSYTALNDNGQGIQCPYIEWLEGSSASNSKPKGKEAQATAEISQLLQRSARTEETSMSVSTIHHLLHNTFSEPFLRTTLKALAANPNTVFEAVYRPVVDKGGKTNREAWHYWANMPASED
jgi:hypothetical protein